ncbi:MAG: hypothetical protein HFJ29_07295 [Clostridia bacterium]|nr:hypothetical protein [Clostridia bacterium]
MFFSKIKKNHSFSKYFFLFLLIFLFVCNTPSSVQAGLFDGTPALVDKLNSAFEKIEDWLLKLATPAAAVAVAVGVFMKKFSFGDEERIRTAKKIIRGSLFSYGFILVLNLTLSAIKSLLT